jgi:hypothetical protein
LRVEFPRLAVRPEEGRVVRVRVPLKEIWLASLIVEVPEVPAFIVSVAGLAEMLKACDTTLTFTVVACASEPLDPVMVTVYVLMAEDLNVQREEFVPARLRVAGLHEAVSPGAGRTAGVSVIFPAKPFWLVRVMLEFAEKPVAKVTIAGLADMVKSTTVTVTVAVCDRTPLVPVTVTV